MKGRTIVITGVTGKAVLPIAAELARDNEVFGTSRFSRADEREIVEAYGIRPCRADLAEGDFAKVPKNPDHLLHFAWLRSSADRLSEAMRVNVEGAGLLLDHVRPARSALIVSSSAVYRGNPDPLHRYREDDPLGAGPSIAAATSATCKIALESVSRIAARTLGIPMTIARLNTVMGPPLAFYGKKLRALLDGVEIILPNEREAHNPIHIEDMASQVEALLDAAGRKEPLTINWSGDEIVATSDALARMEARTGRDANICVRPAPGLAGGTVTDWRRRRAITGPCQVEFTSALDRMLDEMVDGAAPANPQRNWEYSTAFQNRIFRGATD
ncbi:MAG: NAD(P)-dependent oxidoreductase [Novosphingobium sp.]|nr:NAD(P)-dependent oxidoreductase [Novosphingobium sp.]MCP5403632.1 NAD(P)-dependent oxidoreductase [Novosphingobium sp.]